MLFTTRLRDIVSPDPTEAAVTKMTMIKILVIDDEPQIQNIRVYINTLRKKLHDDTSSTARSKYIFNELSIGYRFTDLQPLK